MVGSFQIGKYEVTWGEWKSVRDWAVANGYSDLAGVGEGSADNYPVRNVSWYDVVKWCNAKSEMEGLMPVYQFAHSTYKTGESTPSVNRASNGYRLPLEKEWEWAARGGLNSQGYAYSGGNDINAVAWYWDNSSGAAVDLGSGRGTWPVGLKAANELAIHDMSGNVLEWCEDVVYPSYRCVRGGSWGTEAFIAGVGFRDFAGNPGNRVGNFGFRLARNSGD
jgi:formylglycine-generating enzyme required for sulfatase activity